MQLLIYSLISSALENLISLSRYQRDTGRSLFSHLVPNVVSYLVGIRFRFVNEAKVTFLRGSRNAPPTRKRNLFANCRSDENRLIIVNIDCNRINDPYIL